MWYQSKDNKFAYSKGVYVQDFEGSGDVEFKYSGDRKYDFQRGDKSITDDETTKKMRDVVLISGQTIKKGTVVWYNQGTGKSDDAGLYVSMDSSGTKWENIEPDDSNGDKSLDSVYGNITGSADYGKVNGYAIGTYNFDGGPAFINELGTEGIITPNGTLTALPSKSGIVPADLTKNLYDLGEIAPNLIKKFNNDGVLLGSKNSNSIEDNSMNVQNFYATFETDSGFDFERLLVDARQYVKNNKNK